MSDSTGIFERWGHSERMLRNVFAVKWNVEAIVAEAEARGEKATFWLFTYWWARDYRLCAQHWSTFVRRLRKATGACGLRVFELGRQTKRFHMHAVLDRRVDYPVVEECKRGLVLGLSFVEEVADGKLGGYLHKEVGKQLGGRPLGGRRWATFGDFPGRTRFGDVEVESRMKYWLSCAWATREVGQGRRYTYERAYKMYLDEAVAETRAREAASANEHGEAWEDGEDGETDFNVGDFEN